MMLRNIAFALLLALPLCATENVKAFGAVAKANIKAAAAVAEANIKAIGAVDNTGGGGGTPAVENAWKNGTVATSTAISATPTAGNAMIVGLACYGGGSPANHAVTDNIDTATGWVKIVGFSDGGGNDYSMWYKFNVPSGVTTITANGGVGTVSVVALSHEVSGITAFTGGEFINAASVAQTTWGPGNVNNATAASVLFGFYGAEDIATNPATFTLNGAGTTGTWVYESTANSRELDGTTFIMTASMPNIVVSTTGNKTHVWGTLNNGGYNNAIIAAFH